MSKARFATATLIVAMVMLAGASGGAVAAAGQGLDQTTTSITYGPFTVPAAQGPDQPGMLENAIVREGGCPNLDFCLDMAVTKPCEDCFITGIVPDLVDASTGETINFASGGMLHHVVAVNWSAPDATCPPSLGGGLINWLGLVEGGNERFFASGNERTVLAIPEPYGLWVDRGDDWGLIAHLMNMTNAPRQVDLKFTFTWVPAGSGLEPVTPVWLDIDNCGDSEVDLPQGYSDTEWDWRSTLTGRVVAMAGHLHDNGISIAAENASRNEGICTSVAGYEEGSPFTPVGPGAGTDPLHPADWWHMTTSDHPSASLASYLGHIAGMSGCLPSAEVDAGDTVRLHTQYNLGQDAYMKGGQMGIMVAYLHESPGPEPGPCPNETGLPQYDGCPDTDGDGIPDPDDACPNEAGLPQYDGCPDTDGDGVPDAQDNCPTTPGLSQYDGCPPPDQDGDGVPDTNDACPTTAGLSQYNGCPPPPRPADRQPPQTRFTKHPKGKLLRKRVRVRFAFRSSESGSSFRCKLDRKRWRACTSPRRFKVRRGRHVFKVRAIDAAGNADPTPAVWRWRVRRR